MSELVFHLAKNGEGLGERSESEVQEMLQRGELTHQDLAWRDGMADWLPISSIPELAAAPTLQPVPQAPTISPHPEPPTISERPQSGYSPQRNYLAGEELNLASRWSRLGAAMLDGLFFYGVVFLVMVAVDGLETFTGTNTELSDTALLATGLFAVLFLIVQGFLLTMKSQTLGKMICGIKIVLYPNGEKAGFLNVVFLRGVIGMLPSVIPCVNYIYGPLNVLFIFGDERRCIHDLIASTIVVNAK